MTHFNLIDEEWIPVLTTDGQQRTLGLRQVLTAPTEVVTIAAELPTVSIAIQRLLQAILLRAAGDLPPSAEARAAMWGGWWSTSQFPADKVNAYLDEWHDRFDLFHATFPFFQVPDLHLPSGKGSGLPKLIADVPAGTRFFVMRSGDAVQSLTPGEAAQWLVHAQAFDCAGIKSGVVGDARVSNGKSYSFGFPAWSGNLGVISLEGANLAKTLLLNLVLPATSSEDAPIWETAPQRIPSDGIYPRPRGAAQVWTWPSRMIRLVETDGVVTDVILSNGEKLEPRNRFDVEPMTSWRFSAPQTKKHGQDTFMPLEHNPDRAAWRGLQGILAQAPTGEEVRAKPALSLEWLARLRWDDHLADNQHVRLRCVGMVYGSNNSTFNQDFDDVVPASVAALTRERLRRAAVNAVQASRAAVLALRNLARNIALAAGDSGDGVSEKVNASEQPAWDGLRPHFEVWLSGLTSETDTEEAETRWQSVTSSVIRDVAHALLTSAPSAATFGRTVVLSKRTTHLDVGLATLWFNSALRKALPLAFPPNNTEDSDVTLAHSTH